MVYSDKYKIGRLNFAQISQTSKKGCEKMEIGNKKVLINGKSIENDSKLAP